MEFIDEETLSSSKQFAFRPILWVFSVAFLLLSIVLGTASTIWYTPSIREKIPGYTNPDNEKYLKSMRSQIENLESEVKNKDEFIKSMQNVLGNKETFPQNTKEETQKTIEPVKEPNKKASASNDKKGKAQEVVPQIAQPITGDAPSVVKKSAKVELKIKTILRPVVGYVRENFSPSKGHYGIDIATSEVETVLAATDGYVQISDYTEADGYMIAITNSSGVTTIYKHNSRLLKKKGSYVHTGEPIAMVGNTGENSTGHHLHFEMWYNGEPLNPRDYVIYK